MKLNKITTVAVCALLLTACSDNDDNKLNTKGGVTVEMADADMTIIEVGSLYNVPIKVTGATNGEIIVNVKAEPYGEDSAIEEENYSITSSRIIIPQGSNEGRVEIQPIDDVEENANRSFKLTIASVEGAAVGTDASTIITIEDDDNTPYAKMKGRWAMFAKTVFNNSEDLGNFVNIVLPDPSGDDAASYGRKLYAYGFMGYSFVFVPINYSYDAVNNQVNLSLAVGEPMTDLNSPVSMSGYKVAFYGSSIYEQGGTMNPGKRINMTVNMMDETDHVLYFSQTDNSQEYYVTIRTTNQTQAPYEYKDCIGYFDGFTEIEFIRPELLGM